MCVIQLRCVKRNLQNDLLEVLKYYIGVFNDLSRDPTIRMKYGEVIGQFEVRAKTLSGKTF